MLRAQRYEDANPDSRQTVKNDPRTVGIGSVVARPGGQRVKSPVECVSDLRATVSRWVSWAFAPRDR